MPIGIEFYKILSCPQRTKLNTITINKFVVFWTSLPGTTQNKVCLCIRKNALLPNN